MKASLHYSCDFCGTFLKRMGGKEINGEVGWVCRLPNCTNSGVVVYPQLIPSKSPVTGETKVIRGIDPTLYKDFRITAIQKGCSLGELMNEAMMLRIGQDSEPEEMMHFSRGEDR